MIRSVPRLLWTFALGAALLCGACEGKTDEMLFESVDPDFGGLQGGKTVRILGRNLRLDIGYTVYFGSDASHQVAILNDGTLEAVTPRKRSSGPVDVIVRADNGTVFRLENAFKYVNQAGALLGGPNPSEPNPTQQE